MFKTHFLNRPRFYDGNACVMLSAFLWLFLSLPLSAQDKVGEEIQFARYLLENKAYADATLVLRGLQATETERQDSIEYLMGWSYFNQRKVDSAFGWFARVGPASALYYKSVFHRSFCSIYLGKNEEAKGILASVAPTPDSTLMQLHVFQQSAIALMDRNFEEFGRLTSTLKQPHYPIVAEVANLNAYYQEILARPRKSPWVAGVLSAIIPGAGKIYAGYKMQGVAAFAGVMTFGAAAAESYFRGDSGPRSARFIALGSLFSIFYLGNIWGSALSVKVKQNEFNKEINQAILVDLRLPLVRIFP